MKYFVTGSVAGFILFFIIIFATKTSHAETKDVASCLGQQYYNYEHSWAMACRKIHQDDSCVLDNPPISWNEYTTSMSACQK